METYPYSDYSQIESDFAEKRLHPGDLKQAVGEYLVKIISPLRENLDLSEDQSQAIREGR